MTEPRDPRDAPPEEIHSRTTLSSSLRNLYAHEQPRPPKHKQRGRPRHTSTSSRGPDFDEDDSASDGEREQHDSSTHGASNFRASAASISRYTTPRSLLASVLAWGRSGLLYLVAQRLARLLLVRVSRRYAAMAPRDQNEFDSYLCSMVNAVVVSYRALVLVRAFKANPEVSRAKVDAVITLADDLGGYLLHDVFLLGRALLRNQNALHHFLGFAVLHGAIGAVASMPEITAFMPDYALSEVSTIFLNLAWMLRRVGLGQSWQAHVCKAAFVLTFFLTRVVNLPYLTYTLRTTRKELVYSLGTAGRWAIYSVCALQWFWFYKIVKKVGA